MIGRAVGLAVLVSMLLSAAWPAAALGGPQLAYIEFRMRPSVLRLVGVDLFTTHVQPIAGGATRRVRPLPEPVDAPSWSPDGSLIAFNGIEKTLLGSKEYTEKHHQIYVVKADGSELRPVPGTIGGFAPVFAQDGHTLAFMRKRERSRPNRHGGEDIVYSSQSVWLVDILTGELRQLTPWRNGHFLVPTSSSPDGSTLALTRSVKGRRGAEVVAMRFDGSGSVTLLRHAADAVYSPDGSEFAFVRLRSHTYHHRSRDGSSMTSGFYSTGDIFVANADGSEARRLTKTPGTLELWPSWDPSGQRLAYSSISARSLIRFDIESTILEVNADGSCPTRLVIAPGVGFYTPSWQPGPGREAGRIAC